MGELCAVIEKWGHKEPGLIPHRVLIEMGIATEEELTWFRWNGARTERRTLWFTREESKAIRSHSEFLLASPIQTEGA